jgi:hypothetical protein
MASNHKLTGLIRGRTITGTANQGDTLTVRFDDGSEMTVRTAGGSNSAATGGTVRAVRQAGTRLDLDFEGGGALEITTAEETSTVMIRDKDGVLEYAD